MPKLGKCPLYLAIKVAKFTPIKGGGEAVCGSCSWREFSDKALEGVVWENFVVNFVSFPFILMICSWCSYEI